MEELDFDLLNLRKVYLLSKDRANDCLFFSRDLFKKNAVREMFENRGAQTICISNYMSNGIELYSTKYLPNLKVKEESGSDFRYQLGETEHKVESKLVVARFMKKNRVFRAKVWQGMAYQNKVAKVFFLSSYGTFDQGIEYLGLIIIAEKLCPLTYKKMETEQISSQEKNKIKAQNGEIARSARSKIEIIGSEVEGIVPVIGDVQVNPDDDLVELILEKC